MSTTTGAGVGQHELRSAPPDTPDPPAHTRHPPSPPPAAPPPAPPSAAAPPPPATPAPHPARPATAPADSPAHPTPRTSPPRPRTPPPPHPASAPPAPRTTPATWPPAHPRAVSFHSASTCCRSASSSRPIRLTGRAGSATTASSTRTNRRSDAVRRWTGRTGPPRTPDRPRMPAGRPSASNRSPKLKSRSNFAAAGAAAGRRTPRSAGQLQSRRRCFCRVSMTWNSGWRPATGPGASSSTSRSNGTS